MPARFEKRLRNKGTNRRAKAAASRPFFRRANWFALLICVAFLLGGGGVGSALFNLVVQMLALAILALDHEAVVRFFRDAPRALVALVICTLCLPLVQLVPLPPSIWSALPGRALMSESLALVGAGQAWAPVSVAPANTFVAFLGLIPPLAVLILGWNLPADDRKLIGPGLAALAVFATLLGAVQLASVGTLGVIQTQAWGEPELHATFANRNSAGLFFVLALLAMTGWAFARPRAKWLAGATLCLAVVFVLDLLLTRSRSSIAIGAVAVPLTVLAFVIGRRRARASSQAIAWRPALAICVAAVAFGAAALFLFMHNSRLEATFLRFGSVTDVRPLIWGDTVSAIRRFGPVGSGMGTFDEVFQIDESLEYLNGLRAGRAHNDWLEITLEAGAAGLLLVLCWAGWVLAAGVRSLKGWRGGAASESLAAFAMIACVAIQSILDYPLRNEALFCIAALAVSQLRPITEAARQKREAMA